MPAPERGERADRQIWPDRSAPFHRRELHERLSPTSTSRMMSMARFGNQLPVPRAMAHGHRQRLVAGGKEPSYQREQ